MRNRRSQHIGTDDADEPKLGKPSLKFGLIFPNVGSYCDKELAAQVAILAEKCEFDSFLVWDHYMLPESNQTFEAWILLSYLASKTSTIRLGACVTPIPFRPPSILAKMVSTLDILSNGRTILGVGAGWYRNEFDTYSRWDIPSVTVQKTKEGIDLIIKLWTESKVTFTGRYYSVKNAVLEPKPVQKPHPPLWFGTCGHHMMRLAARYGDGWIPVGIRAKEYRDYARFIKEHNPKESFTYAFDSDPIEDTRSVIRSIEEYEEAGCDYFTIVWSYPIEQLLDRIRWFSKEVTPSFK